MRAIIIGDRETVIVFRLLGIEGIPVTSPEDMKEKLESVLKRQDVALVLLTDNYSESIREIINRLRIERELPLICEIPSRKSFIRGRVGELFYKSLLKDVLGIEI